LQQKIIIPLGIKTFFTFISLVIFLSGCAQLRSVTKPGPGPSPIKVSKDKRSVNIRVALVKHAKRVKISSYHKVKIFDMRTRKIIGNTRLTEDTQIVIRDGRIMIAGHSLYTPRIRLVPATGEFLSVNGRRYRGQIEVKINEAQGDLLIVNYIPLEQYLLGVVPNEVVPTWPAEALKTQAIASRTFALYKMSGRAQYDYDLDASVNSQVYGGLDSEKATTSMAVRDTRGLVAVFHGKYIAAFYHSNCGGHTADVKEVWGSKMAYLSGTFCGFCDNGPHFTWSQSMPKAEISARLRKRGIPVQKITRLELVGRDSSGRVKAIRVYHTAGSEEIRTAAFRMMIGPDKIRSTKFYIQDAGKKVVFKGKGWGHGVGLCQEGACGMARSGFSYRDILRHYYPGIEIRQAGE